MAQAWMIWGITAVLIALLAVFIFLLVKKGKRMETDYYALFVMGITWTAVGIPLKNYGLFAVGIVFLAIGIANRSKWKKRRAWKDLSDEEKKLKAFALAVIGLAVLVAVAVILYGLVS